jgi:hypothetical protein
MNKMTAALTGTNDMCATVPSEQWGTAEVVKFLLDGESPIVVFRSNEGEYCFSGVCDAPAGLWGVGPALLTSLQIARCTRYGARP